MGYSTDFTGSFTLDKPLTAEQSEYLKMFSGTRRMKRNTNDIKKITGKALNSRCLILIANLGLGLGKDGEFFCGPLDDFGQEHDVSIVEYNNPPSTQPGLWCQWAPTEDNSGIEWNGAEKFYHYTEWLQYLISNFIKPWGLKLNGTVKWQGEDPSDVGKIVVRNNTISTLKGEVVYKLRK